jgi:hypothetical protein
MTKAFVSFHHGNDQWAKEHLSYMSYMSYRYGCFEDLSVSTGDIADDGRSSEAIRVLIRDDYLRDSEVTILLCGEETKRRKHIDWELKSRMINGAKNAKSGLLVIMLPSVDTGQFYSSMPGEVQTVHSDFNQTGKSLVTMGTRRKFEDAWPSLPARVVDNMLVEDARISIVGWDTIATNPLALTWLVDRAGFWGKHNNYDCSRTMRRAELDSSKRVRCSILSGWFLRSDTLELAYTVLIQSNFPL